MKLVQMLFLLIGMVLMSDLSFAATAEEECGGDADCLAQIAQAKAEVKPKKGGNKKITEAEIDVKIEAALRDNPALSRSTIRDQIMREVTNGDGIIRQSLYDGELSKLVDARVDARIAARGPLSGGVVAAHASEQKLPSDVTIGVQWMPIWAHGEQGFYWSAQFGWDQKISDNWWRLVSIGPGISPTRDIAVVGELVFAYRIAGPLHLRFGAGVDSDTGIMLNQPSIGLAAGPGIELKFWESVAITIDVRGGVGATRGIGLHPELAIPASFAILF